MYLSSPLRVNIKGRKFRRVRTVKGSIDNFIELIINTPVGESLADPDFGFVFSNMRFEMFNENEGVILNQNKDEQDETFDLYKKKISGTSKNINTFATDLRDIIVRYEQRLSSVTVSMSYARDQRKIFVTIKGEIIESRESYQYNTTIRVWS